MTEQDAKVQACWSSLSEELAVVLRIKGPVLIGDVGGVYTSVHGKPFILHGRKLRACLRDHLRGIEFNSELGRLELEKGAGVAPNAVGVAPNAPTTVPTKLNAGNLPAENKSGGAPKEPTTAVRENTAPYSAAAQRPPAPAVPRPPAPTAAVGPLEPIAAQNTEKPLPREPAATAARPAAAAGTRHIANTATGNTAGNTTRPATEATSTLPTAAPTAPPAPPACFRASESTTTYEGYPDPPAPQRPYLPVDSSSESRQKALAPMFPGDREHVFASWPLERVCEGRTVAVQLEGQKLRLGTEAGKNISAIKPKIDSATSTLGGGARLMTFRDEGSCSGGGVGRVVVRHELKEAEEKELACVAGKDMGLPGYLNPRVVDGRNGSFLGRTSPIEEDTNIITAAAEDANSPLEVLRRIPEVFLEEHLSTRNKENLQDLVDIMLDDGCRPKARLRGRGNVFLCSDPSIVVTAQDLDMVLGRLEVDGKFDEDNRAGFPDQLHRISVLRRKDGKIIGLTLRIGRFFKGSAGLIDDLLFPVSNSPAGKPRRAPSILVLGVPGSGKTTVIRDICRKLSATQTVMIVDTSNEIGGGGDTPHREAIGESRRIMVPRHQKQHRVMTEALQNHTPQTIVVDEISDKKEACACLDIKERGVRMVASAHGDLRSILKSLELDTLVGGKTSITVGDARARDNGGNKVLTQRAGAPIFDVVIELTSENVDEWSIVRNVGGAVDALLSGRSYQVERRTRLNHYSRSTHEDAGSEDVIFQLVIDKVANRSQDTC